MRGDKFVFIASATNTGAVTLNVNALGAVAVLSADGWALTGGEIRVNQIVELYYDGTNFRFPGLSRQSIAADGYLVLPGGVIMQWGDVVFSATNTAAVTFPLAFPTAVLNVQTSYAQAAGGSVVASVASPTTSGFTFNLSASSSSTGFWFAVGH